MNIEVGQQDDGAEVSESQEVIYETLADFGWVVDCGSMVGVGPGILMVRHSMVS